MGNRRKPRRPDLAGGVAFYSTGHEQEATPHRQLAGRARSELLYDDAVANKRHLWQVFVVHLASDSMLDARDGVDSDGPGYLDVDTLMGPPAIACFVCEQPYAPELRRAACPGEPR